MNTSDKLKIFREIISGWSKLAVRDPEVEKLATDRLNICFDCKKFNVVSKRCGVCNCYMPAKTRSLKSKCPVNLW